MIRDGAGRRRRARRRQVVLAAGAIGTPQIMMLSGLGPAAHLQRARHRGGARPAGRRRQSAGSSADQDVVPHQRRADAERFAGRALGQGEDRRAIRAVALGPDGDGAEPARPLHALASALCDAQHRVPCAAAVARRLRRAAAPSSGDHGLGLQSAAEQHRCGAAGLGGLSRSRRSSRRTTCPTKRTATWRSSRSGLRAG